MGKYSPQQEGVGLKMAKEETNGCFDTVCKQKVHTQLLRTNYIEAALKTLREHFKIYTPSSLTKKELFNTKHPPNIGPMDYFYSI